MVQERIGKCTLCQETYFLAARGLCTRCYPKEREAGRLELYARTQDAWKSIAGKVIDLYRQNKTALQVGKELGISDTTVRNILRKSGVKRRRTGYDRIHLLNEQAFDDLSVEAAAYWLGFLYADGHVRSTGAIMLHLHIQDLGHLEKFRLFLGSDATIVQRQRPNGLAPAVALTVYSAKLGRRLSGLGIVTGRNCFNRVLKELPESNYRHFIRGCIDGDGTISKADQQRRVKLVGQLDMLQWVSSVVAVKVEVPERTIYPFKSIYMIAYNGKFQAQKVAEWLYSNATVYMERKHFNFLAWSKHE